VSPSKKREKKRRTYLVEANWSSTSVRGYEKGGGKERERKKLGGAKKQTFYWRNEGAKRADWVLEKMGG